MDNLLVVAATKKELRSLFSDIDPSSLQLGQVVRKRIKKRTLNLVVCGIGPINGSLFLERAIIKTRAQGIINIGIAGSFDIKKIPIGSITIAKKEIWPEYGLKKKDYIDPKGLKYGLIKLNTGKIIYNEIDIPIEENLDKMGLSFGDNFYTTTNLTVAGVTGTKEEAARLEKLYKADTENMEGFSLAYTSLIHELPFIEIRTISNLVGSRDVGDWNIKKALTRIKDIMCIF